MSEAWLDPEHARAVLERLEVPNIGTVCGVLAEAGRTMVRPSVTGRMLLRMVESGISEADALAAVDAAFAIALRAAK